MAKFSIPDKLKLLALVATMTVHGAFAKTETKLSRQSAQAAAERLVVQAKELMTHGKRRAAIGRLDEALSISQSKPQRRDIEKKRELFTEQFFTSESFQKFQEAKGYALQDQWEDCLRAIVAVGATDQDNLMILRVKAQCESGAKMYDEANKTLKTVLAVVPGDVGASFGLVENALVQKQTVVGLAILEDLEPKPSELERFVILKARLLRQSGKTADAVDLLKQDQEQNVDHIEVPYELGVLYSTMEGHDWAARRMLSLFITRCKRMKESDLKKRRLDVLVTEAQAKLDAIDQKLGVQ